MSINPLEYQGQALFLLIVDCNSYTFFKFTHFSHYLVYSAPDCLRASAVLIGKEKRLLTPKVKIHVPNTHIDERKCTIFVPSANQQDY
jgi:hypothetical protein